MKLFQEYDVLKTLEECDSDLFSKIQSEGIVYGPERMKLVSILIDKLINDDGNG